MKLALEVDVIYTTSRSCSSRVFNLISALLLILPLTIVLVPKALNRMAILVFDRDKALHFLHRQEYELFVSSAWAD